MKMFDKENLKEISSGELDNRAKTLYTIYVYDKYYYPKHLLESDNA